MSHRAAPTRSLLLAGALLLAALAGCSDDDGGDADESSSTTTTAPAETTQSTLPGSGKPFNESDLVDALLDPADIADGLTVSPVAGASDVELELCPGVMLEATWEDQAAQGMARMQDQELLVVNQAVLAFADAAAAEAFTSALLDGYLECDPALASDEVTGVGDQAVILGAAAGGEGAASAVVARSGAHVTRLESNGSPPVDGTPPVIDADLAARLVDNLPVS